MKKLPKISEILHLAADEYLYNGIAGCANPKNWSRRHYSCDAIDAAIDAGARGGICDDLSTRIRVGLSNMGLIAASFDQFAEFEVVISRTKESQGARYSWLKFAAMIAEEQGV